MSMKRLCSSAGATPRWPFLASSIESDDLKAYSELRRSIAPRPMQIRGLICLNGFRRLWILEASRTTGFCARRSGGNGSVSPTTSDAAWR